MTPPTVASSIEPPPLLASPAQTHSIEVELVVLVNKTIERLIDKYPGLSFDARRAFERAAKARCAEILKRTAVECATAINSVTRPSTP